MDTDRVKTGEQAKVQIVGNTATEITRPLQDL